MGVIQNAVNQMIGTTAMAARLAPGYDKRQELRQIGQLEQALAKQAEAISERGGLRKAEILNKDIQDQMIGMREAMADVAKKRFDLQPTAENFENMIKKTRAIGGMRSVIGSIERVEKSKMDQAMMNAAGIQEARQTQKARFDAFLANIEDILNKPTKKGTVGGDK